MYSVNELTRRYSVDGVAELSVSLFDAAIDLNPQQIEPELFAFRSPLSESVLIVNEVGLGKTIEAGHVIRRCWPKWCRNVQMTCPLYERPMRETVPGCQGLI